MVCPACEHGFHPEETTSPAGYRVAAPEQSCPSCGAAMVSGYGAASGAIAPGDERPLARNTSAKFDEGRNFANKLWNAGRFTLISVGDEPVQPLADVAQSSDIQSPMGRVLEPRDIAHAVAFLCHPDTWAMTGQVLHVNAGALMP